MNIGVIYNLSKRGVINVFGRQNREQYTVEEIDRVVGALRDHNHTVETFEGDKFLIEKLEAFMPRVLKGETPGMVFNLAYGIQGESRYTHIPSLLEMLGVPYVGSGPLAHSIALDKAMTNMVLSRAGLPTPRFVVATDETIALPDGLAFPVIVKPKDEAVSFGIRVVDEIESLREAVGSIISEFSQPALVEEFLPGRELNIGILGNGETMELLPIVEVDFGDSKERYQTFASKKGHWFGHVCPARIPDALAQRIREIAAGAFAAIGCRDCARIDIRLDAEDRPHILEINSMAAIHRHGSYFAAARQVGYDYAGMINQMVQVAVRRYFGRRGEVPSKGRAAIPGRNDFSGRVTDYLRSAAPKMEKRLAELVDCNSFARNKEGTDRVGRMVRRGLEQCGFACQVVPQAEIGDLLLLQNTKGEERADVLLLCHLDVFALAYDAHRHFNKEGNRLYGAGTAESKGGLVVIEYALRALRHLRALDPLKVKVLLTTDNSLGNKYSASVIQREADRSACVLSFKLGGPEGEAVTRRNGTGFYTALVESTGPRLTDQTDRGVVTSINEMVHKVRAWNRLSRPEEGIVVEVTSLKAEARAGNLPQSAQATIFLSFPDEKKGEQLAQEIGKIARKRLGDQSRCNLSGGIMHPPFHETDKVRGLHRELQQVAEEIGLSLGAGSRLTASEVNWVDGKAAAIDGLGPIGRGTRTENEQIEAHTLVERAVLLALFLRKLQHDSTTR